jgi:hypothetical protein
MKKVVVSWKMLLEKQKESSNDCEMPDLWFL